MRDLPVFSTIGQAFGFVLRHIGLLVQWLCMPLALSALYAAALYGLWKILDPAKSVQMPRELLGALGSGGALSVVAVAAVTALGLAAVALLIWIPYFLRVNQLAVTGRVEPGSYASGVPSLPARRYLGYAVLVNILRALAISVSFSPIIIAARQDASLQNTAGPMSFLPLLFFGLLFLAFVWLTPLLLVFPATATEEKPSLARAYALGKHCKLRLFMCSVLCIVPLSLCSILAESAFAPQRAQASTGYLLSYIGVQAILAFFMCITTEAVPAIAYRILSGLPDPNAPAGAQQHGQGAGI